MSDAAAAQTTNQPTAPAPKPRDMTPEEAASRLLPSITPEELTAAIDTPGAFKDIAKGDLFMELARLRRLMRNNSISLADRLKYLQLLARMAGVDAAPTDTDASATNVNLPQINIVINGQQAVGVVPNARDAHSSANTLTPTPSKN